mmetsp:Transcript_16735/g.19363  ORF Transcript_16735/g.19363 Transcript_16735/m.19363 type:complete len:412 (+) Transcript_16735:34-1269(+)
MLINIPIVFYAASLAALYFKNESLELLGSFGRSIVTQTITFLVYFPIVATFLTWISDIPRQRKLSKLYDSDGQPIRAFIGAAGEGWSKKHLPFLPDAEFTSDKKHNTIREYLIQKQNEKNCIKDSYKSRTNRTSWALVTGASKGIGRALAISLARRNIPVVLVARGIEKLQSLSQLIEECYGVKTLIIKCDIGSDNDLDKMMDILAKANINIEILVNNAGLGETGQLVEMSEEKIEQMNQVNVRGTTMLNRRFGAEMKARKRGRIVNISSIAGAVPGVPTSTVYAATKAYQRSLSSGLGRELEGSGVGVTCVMPGAVKDTIFSSVAHMEESTVFNNPIGILSPEIVAESAVRAMISGHQEVFVGWLYVIMGRFMSNVLPDRLLMLACELAFRPLPFKQMFLGRSKTVKKIQ